MSWRTRVLLVWSGSFAVVFATLELALGAGLWLGTVLALAGAWTAGELMAAGYAAGTEEAIDQLVEPHRSEGRSAPIEIVIQRNAQSRPQVRSREARLRSLQTHGRVRATRVERPRR
jgi:hypothetical protein